MSPDFADATRADSSSFTTCEGSGRRATGSSLEELMEVFSMGKVSTAFGTLPPGMYYDTERSDIAPTQSRLRAFGAAGPSSKARGSGAARELRPAGRTQETR